MSNFESGDFGNLDPADFGEPTEATRSRFAAVLDSLKQLTIGNTAEVDDIIGDVDTLAQYDVAREDLCPLTFYQYDQLNDPLFSPGEETYLKFDLTDGDPSKIGNWEKVIGDIPPSGIHYMGPDVEICYDSTLKFEMLYITEPHDGNMSIFSDDFIPMMMGRVKNHMQAIDRGSANPTEGSMKRLINVLEQECAKRILDVGR